MAQAVGAGPKSNSQTGYSGGILQAINRNLVNVPGVKGLNDTLISQITEALRTGGIGAQLPIVSQAVSGANQATSQALQGTRDSLASSGLERTPYGQSILAGQRQSGAQAAAAIPTNYASQYIGQAPQIGSNLLQAILQGSQRSTAGSAPYSH